MSCVCVCVCVLFTERKRMKENEIQVLKEERHCLGFFFPQAALDPRFPSRQPAKTHPRAVSFEIRTTTANKFTHSTMDKPANQRELRVVSLYLPEG